MNTQKVLLQEKIMKLSKTVHILLTVLLGFALAAVPLFIVLIIAGPLEFGFWGTLSLAQTTISLQAITGYFVLLALLIFARRIFRKLRTSGNPFSPEVDLVHSVKQVSKAMIVGAIVTLNFTILVLALIVRVLALIIEFGSDLQTENDSIL